MLLAALPLAAGGPPVAPKGFTLAPDHNIGDPTITGGAVLVAPQLLVHKTEACPGSGGDSCFPIVSKACLADDKCSAFAYSSSGTGVSCLPPTACCVRH